jgi:transcriptional regulator with XRE-family HTH domain
MFDYVSMGNRIFHIRTSKNIKQREMGQKLGMGQSAYSKLETGNKEMTIDQVYRIADILEVPVFWLIDPDGQEALTEEEALEVTEYKNYLINKRKK